MENNTKNKHKDIKGWGVDADPKNDPTYPIKDRNNAEHKGYSWDRPPQQPINIEVMHSNERPNITAVFGTAVPPSGLSGMIRRYAFQHSENSYRHWLSLIMADRINEVEGIIDDLKEGHIPNIFAEKGLPAEWKYNRTNFLMQMAAGVAAVTTIVALISRRK